MTEIGCRQNRSYSSDASLPKIPFRALMANRHQDARDNVVETAQRNIWLIDIEKQKEQAGKPEEKGFWTYLWDETWDGQKLLALYRKGCCTSHCTVQSISKKIETSEGQSVIICSSTFEQPSIMSCPIGWGMENRSLKISECRSNWPRRWWCFRIETRSQIEPSALEELESPWGYWRDHPSRQRRLFNIGRSTLAGGRWNFLSSQLSVPESSWFSHMANCTEVEQRRARDQAIDQVRMIAVQLQASSSSQIFFSVTYIIMTSSILDLEMKSKVLIKNGNRTWSLNLKSL